MATFTKGLLAGFGVTAVLGAGVVFGVYRSKNAEVSLQEFYKMPRLNIDGITLEQRGIVFSGNEGKYSGKAYPVLQFGFRSGELFTVNQTTTGLDRIENIVIDEQKKQVTVHGTTAFELIAKDALEQKIALERADERKKVEAEYKPKIEAYEKKLTAQPHIEWSPATIVTDKPQEPKKE